MKTLKILTIVAIVLTVATLGFAIYSHVKNKKESQKAPGSSPMSLQRDDVDFADVIE